MSEITDKELMRYVVRSHARLRSLVAPHIVSKDTQTGAWFRWDKQLMEEATKRGLLPSVPVTKETELGKKSGAI